MGLFRPLSRGGLEKSKEKGRKKTREKLKYQQKLYPMKTQTEKRTQKVEVEIIDDETIELTLHDAVRFPLLPEKARDMLKELYEWLSKGRDYNAHVVLQRGFMGLRLQRDITNEVDMCIDACTRGARERGLNPLDVGPSCAEECYTGFKKETEFEFRILLTEVKKFLDEHDLRHKIYDYWDFTTKKLVFVVKL
jgi:hypothetical protein